MASSAVGRSRSEDLARKRREIHSSAIAIGAASGYSNIESAVAGSRKARLRRSANPSDKARGAISNASPEARTMAAKPTMAAGERGDRASASAAAAKAPASAALCTSNKAAHNRGHRCSHDAAAPPHSGSRSVRRASPARREIRKARCSVAAAAATTKQITLATTGCQTPIG